MSEMNFGGSDAPGPVGEFQRKYRDALEATSGRDYEPSTSGLYGFELQMRQIPPPESPELRATRQAVLSDPEQLRSYFAVFSHHDAALRKLHETGSVDLDI